MTLRKYLVTVSAIALSSSPLSANEGPMAGIDFSLSEIAPPPAADELPPTLQPEERADWFMSEQLRRTEASDPNPNSGALASGWIDRNVFVLIEPGSVAYLIRRPDPIAGSRPATEVCRISIATRETGLVFPDTIAVLSQNERGCNPQPSRFLKRLVQARPRAGELASQTRFEASDGSALEVRHLTNTNAVGLPLVGSEDADTIRSIYQMPTSWLLVGKTAQKAWIIENDDETYALAVKFDIERTGRRSGCIVEADDGRVPSLDWISDEVRYWCRERDRAFTRSIRRPEFEPRPSPPRNS